MEKVKHHYGDTECTEHQGPISPPHSRNSANNVFFSPWVRKTYVMSTNSVTNYREIYQTMNCLIATLIKPIARLKKKMFFKKCGGKVTVLPSIGSVEVKSSLGGNQKDVVCSNGHNSFLDGLLAWIGSPVGDVCGVGIVCTSLALLFGVGSQELPHIFTVRRYKSNAKENFHIRGDVTISGI